MLETKWIAEKLIRRPTSAEEAINDVLSAWVVDLRWEQLTHNVLKANLFSHFILISWFFLHRQLEFLSIRFFRLFRTPLTKDKTWFRNRNDTEKNKNEINKCYFRLHRFKFIFKTLNTARFLIKSPQYESFCLIREYFFCF